MSLTYLQEFETDIGTTIQVYKHSQGFAVRLYDQDSQKVVGIRIFKTEDAANVYAEDLYLNS